MDARTKAGTDVYGRGMTITATTLPALFPTNTNQADLRWCGGELLTSPRQDVQLNASFEGIMRKNAARSEGQMARALCLFTFNGA